MCCCSHLQWHYQAPFLLVSRMRIDNFRMRKCEGKAYWQLPNAKIRRQRGESESANERYLFRSFARTASYCSSFASSSLTRWSKRASGLNRKSMQQPKLVRNSPLIQKLTIDKKLIIDAETGHWYRNWPLIQKLTMEAEIDHWYCGCFTLKTIVLSNSQCRNYASKLCNT